MKQFLENELTPEQFEWYKDFVASFNRADADDYIIDFDVLYKMLNFSRKSHAKRILDSLDNNEEKLLPISGQKSTEDITQDNDKEKLLLKSQQKSTGGRPEEKIKLTIKGAHKFCMEARTPKAKQIREIILEIMEKIALFDTLEAFQQNRWVKHNSLIEQHHETQVVYLADVYVLHEDKIMVVKKIGYTTDLKKRHEDLQKIMKTAVVFSHVFPCFDAYRFEQFILHLAVIKSHMWKNNINGHVSKETVSFSDSFTEADLLQLIYDNISKFNITEELRKGELLVKQKELELEKLKAENEKMKNEAEKMKHEADLKRLNIVLEKEVRKTNPKTVIQQIDPKTNTVKAYYPSPGEASRLNKKCAISRIKAAIQRDYVYKGYRWHIGDSKDPNKIVGLRPEKIIRPSTRGLVAELDVSQKNIVEVYPSQAAIKEKYKLKSRGTISNAVKKGTRSGSFFYKWWDDCSQELKEAYISVHGEPDEYETIGKRVYRIDPVSGNINYTYPNMQLICDNFRIGRAKLVKALETGCLAEGFFWKYVDGV